MYGVAPGTRRKRAVEEAAAAAAGKADPCGGFLFPGALHSNQSMDELMKPRKWEEGRRTRVLGLGLKRVVFVVYICIFAIVILTYARFPCNDDASLKIKRMKAVLP